MLNKDNIALYIHIPFCDHKCIYCDFYSIIKNDREDEYFDALISEIKNYSSYYQNKKISSIFFGGGTPSFVKPENIKRVIDKISESGNIKSDCEITMETNPGTVDIDKLKQFKDAGINRVSIGVQSFDDEELKFLTRIHNKKTAIDTIKYASNVFDNISIDLIFNLPNQTENMWRNNLKLALDLPIKHISAYSLILERGTILNKMVLDGKVKMQDEDYDAGLYQFTLAEMHKNGFEQYEVSNFCKQGFECKHNKSYWEYNNYLGFGTAAHSFYNGKRWWNYSSLTMYIEKINSSGNAVRSSEELTKNQMTEEYIMLALRSGGLDINIVTAYFDKEWFTRNEKFLNTLVESEYLLHNENLFRLTAKGYAICDEILLQFK